MNNDNMRALTAFDIYDESPSLAALAAKEGLDEVNLYYNLLFSENYFEVILEIFKDFMFVHGHNLYPDEYLTPIEKKVKKPYIIIEPFRKYPFFDPFGVSQLIPGNHYLAPIEQEAFISDIILPISFGLKLPKKNPPFKYLNNRANDDLKLAILSKYLKNLLNKTLKIYTKEIRLPPKFQRYIDNNTIELKGTLFSSNSTKTVSKKFEEKFKDYPLTSATIMISCLEYIIATTPEIKLKYSHNKLFKITPNRVKIVPKFIINELIKKNLEFNYNDYDRFLKRIRTLSKSTPIMDFFSY